MCKSCILLELLHVHVFIVAVLCPSGSGRIVDVYAIDFEALSDSGKIVVDVENTGDITAEFSVSWILPTIHYNCNYFIIQWI